MKRIAIIVFACLATALGANAQDNSQPITAGRVILGADAGVSLPSGDFGNPGVSPSEAEYSSKINGYAKAGYSYDGYIGVRLTKHLGVMAQIGANTNPYNVSDLSTQDGNASVSGDYHVYEYFLGPYLTWSFSRFNLEAKFLGGLVTANYPTSIFTYNGLTNTYGNAIQTSFNTGSGFGYCAGAKLSYLLIGNTLGVGVGFNYISTSINYDGLNTYMNSNQPDQTSSYNTKMNISIVEPYISASLNF